MTQAVTRLLQIQDIERKRLSEGLEVYRPTEIAMDVHLCKSPEIVVRGGNQSGKTQCAAVDVSSAATGLPILGSDGNPLPRRFPEDKPLLIWIFGYDGQHIGGTIYRKLFTAEDSMYIIDDEETGIPRVWNPRDPSDYARIDERRMSEPLIPPRLIDPDGWAWEDKGERHFTVCRLLNGTEIRAYSSGGQCPQGIAVDLIWVDEDIKDPEYYSDWRARIAKKNGHIIWTAFPWARNPRLMELAKRAELKEDESDDRKAGIREFRFNTSRNTYLEEETVTQLVESWESEGETVLAAREAGDFPTDNVLMYPTFHRDHHGIDHVRCPDSPAARIIQSTNGSPPEDWMRLMALDPGSAKCATMFACVPPPEVEENVLIFYDEIFLKNTMASEVAEHCLPRFRGHRFRKLIIDNRMGRQRNTDGIMVRETYLREFRKLKIDSEFGTTFFFGDDRITYRASLVRSLLKTRKDEPRPRIMFWLPNLPQTVKEFALYKRRIAQKEYQDEPIRSNNDCMNCVEYIVAAEEPYSRPEWPQGRPKTEQEKWIEHVFGKKSKESGFSFGAPV